MFDIECRISSTVQEYSLASSFLCEGILFLLQRKLLFFINKEILLQRMKNRIANQGVGI